MRLWLGLVKVRPETDAKLRAMPIKTKEQSVVFLTSYRGWLQENSPYGAVLSANFVPATVRAPDICNKAALAEVIAEACYWQMAYEKAKVKFYGLPYNKWCAERIKRGLPIL